MFGQNIIFYTDVRENKEVKLPFFYIKEKKTHSFFITQFLAITLSVGEVTTEMRLVNERGYYLYVG